MNVGKIPIFWVQEKDDFNKLDPWEERNISPPWVQEKHSTGLHKVKGSLQKIQSTI